MRIVNQGRGTGKTFSLVVTSHVTGIPIVVSTDFEKRIILQDYKDKYDIEVYTVDEITGMTFNKGILVDEMDFIMERLLGFKVIAGTTTA